MRTICQKLMQGGTLKRVRKELDLHVTVFNMFIGEIKRLLIKAGIQVRGV
jgi:DUF438 domain-containing protein